MLCRWLLQKNMRVAAVSLHWHEVGWRQNVEDDYMLEVFEVGTEPQYGRYEGRMLLCGLSGASGVSNEGYGAISIIMRAAWLPELWLSPPDPDSDDLDFDMNEWESGRREYSNRSGAIAGSFCCPKSVDTVGRLSRGVVHTRGAWCHDYSAPYRYT